MADNTNSISYSVTIQPLESNNTYVTSVVDVSDFVKINGIQKIRSAIDSSDYNIGAFTFNDITLKCFNENGKFNDQNDSRSIFPFIRDRAKVVVNFVLTDTESDGDETTQLQFKGLINEEATRSDPIKDEVRFKVLSFDSVIRNTKVASGIVVNGFTISQAILAVLADIRIQSVLNTSSANITVPNNITIDDGSDFTDRSTADALDELLLVGNAVLIIDENDNVIVKSREPDVNLGASFNFFGPFDEQGRENIIGLRNYNTGFHRMFTTVVFNGQSQTNTAIADEYGDRIKEIDFGWITDTAKAASVAAVLVDEFEAPKIEMQIDTDTQRVKDVELLDLVSVNYPLRTRPTGDFLPVIGLTKIGDATEPLPDQFGSLEIDPTLAFKVIAIEHNPQKFETRLKLRQRGNDLNDGTFIVPGSCLVGIAVIGECVLGDAGDTCATWNPSVTGAALIGCTEIA